MNLSLSPFAPENLNSRDGFGSPVPRQPAHLHTQAEPGAYLRDSSRVPRRRPFNYCYFLKKNLNASSPSEYPRVLYLQPMIPPKRFDIFPPDWGILRRSRCVQIFLLKWLGGIIDHEDKTSLWHLNGLYSPYHYTTICKNCAT